SLAGFGIEERPLAICAAGGAVHYLKETQHSRLQHLHRISFYSDDDHLILDATTRRNLELTANLFDGSSSGCLLELLDCSSTPMGSRALRELLSRPFGRIEAIEPRLDALEAWTLQPDRLAGARACLARIRD